MSSPYRDADLECPACKGVMREFRERLLCDACDGIMVTVADLAAAVEDLTSVQPTLSWDHERTSTRHCPRCRAPMMACRIVLHIEGTIEEPRPELDRCNRHGVWFDRGELASVLEKIVSKGHGAKVVAAKAPAHREAVPDQGRWSAMFPKFGGHGGF